MTPCLGCGHAKRHHVNGTGLCLVYPCHMCLIYRPSPDAGPDSSTEKREAS